MERKNGKEGAAPSRLNRALIWTFCFALAATLVWENGASSENHSASPQLGIGNGFQEIPYRAWQGGLRVLPEAHAEVVVNVDQKSEKAISDPAFSIPSVTPTVTGLPFDEPQRAAVPSYLKRGERFHPLIVRVSKAHHVDPALVKAIIMAESGYNPQALSKDGAGGLMQLMPGTADSLGVQDIFDPEDNVSGGVKYLKQLLNEFDGEIKLALAAYNAGSSKVKTYKGVPPIGATQAYINKVIKYYQHYKKRLAGSRRDL
jgi:hypothetical protein